MMRRWLACGKLVIAVVVAWRCAAGLADETAPAEAAAAIEVRVTDAATKAPLAGTPISAMINRKVAVGKTDDQGVYRLSTPTDAVESVTVTVTQQHFVPMRWTWRKTSGELLPRTMPFALEKATSLGGIIHDEQGQPVAGTTVSIIVPSQGDEQPRPRVYDLKATTDREGRWHIDVLPAELSDLWIRLAHPDFISDTTYNATPRPSIEKLRDRSGIMTMRRGTAVRGRVVDDQWQPIAGAVVRQGNDRFGTRFPETKTDQEGKFVFSQVGLGPLVLTAQAAGHAPDLKQVVVSAEPLDEIEFALAPGRTLRGRVVDAEGQPIAKAFVSADTWRQFRTLEWRVDTDAEGRFEWHDAPEDAVKFSIGKSGYMSVRHYQLAAGDQEHTVKLSPPLEVIGRVVDDASGEPVASFQLIKGIVFQQANRPSWQRQQLVRGTGGEFALTFAEPYDGFVVRVEALGYAPAVSKTLKPGDSKQSIEFRLQSAVNIAGVLRDEKGAPLANQPVAIVVGQLGVQVTGGKVMTEPSGRTTTDAEGRFKFPPQTEPYLLVAACPQGFAAVPQASFELESEVKLAPWARLEGRVKVGKLGPRGHVSVHSSLPYVEGFPSYNASESVTADDEGRFVVERFAPGTAYLSLTDGGIRTANGMTTTRTLRGTQLEIEAGQTVIADLIEEGRTVVGRIVNDDGSPAADWGHSHVFIRQHNALNQLPFPEGWAKMTAVEQKAWITAFGESPEGQIFLQLQRLNNRNYPAALDADGRFSVEAIPPGSYRLTASVFAAQAGNPRALGNVNHDFTVPDDTHKSDEPVDLGDLPLSP